MTAQQLFALANPCFLAGEAVDQRFRRFRECGPFVISLIVTVNAGYE